MTTSTVPRIERVTQEYSKYRYIENPEPGRSHWQKLRRVDQQTGLPLYRDIWPVVFNDGNKMDPYFNDEDDLQDRALSAMSAAQSKAVSGFEQSVKEAKEKLNGLNASASIDLIVALPIDEQRIYLEAEQRGKNRKEVLTRFGIERRPEPDEDETGDSE